MKLRIYLREDPKTESTKRSRATTTGIWSFLNSRC
jgi:hypothetical protein